MSPEQLSAGTVDARSDIYALGLILYELVTGKQPFLVSDERFLSRQLFEMPPRPSQAAPAGQRVSRRLDELILQCLAKEREKRPATMQEVVNRLHLILQTQSTAMEPVLAMQWPEGRPSRTRKTAWGWTLSLLLLAGGAVGAWFWLAPREPLNPVTAPVVAGNSGVVEIEFVSTPEAAEVIRLRDKKRLGRTPFLARLVQSDARDRVEFRKPGFLPSEQEISYARNGRIAVQLAPVPPPRPKEHGPGKGPNPKDPDATLNPFQ